MAQDNDLRLQHSGSAAFSFQFAPCNIVKRLLVATLLRKESDRGGDL